MDNSRQDNKLFGIITGLMPVMMLILKPFNNHKTPRDYLVGPFNNEFVIINLYFRWLAQVMLNKN